MVSFIHLTNIVRRAGESVPEQLRQGECTSHVPGAEQRCVLCPTVCARASPELLVRVRTTLRQDSVLIVDTCIALTVLYLLAFHLQQLQHDPQSFALEPRHGRMLLRLPSTESLVPVMDDLETVRR